MFRAERPRIRDVDVEVVALGEAAIEPASEELPNEATNNGTEWRSLLPGRRRREVAPSSSPEPGFAETLALNGNTEGVLEAELETIEPVENPPSAEPILFETAIDESPPIEVPPPSEALPDVDAEPHEPVEKPASKPRRKPTSRPRRKRTSAKKASAAPPETSEPAEAPAVETPAVETPAADEPESPPSLPPRPKARVVWSPAPTSGVQRTHTLKLTKPAPSRSIPETSMPAREPAPKPPSPPRTKPPAREVPPDADVEARPPVADTPAHDEVPAAPATREQTCDILFWRGYRKAAFYARTFDETGEAVAVAESPFFRPQGTGAPEPTEAAKAAYDALRSQLVAAGWEPVSTGDAWFDETFLLTGAVEPEPE